MTLKEVISHLVETDARAHYKFERIVLAILEKHLNESNKELVLNVRFPQQDMEVDAIVPHGMLDHEHSDTIVEIKYFRDPTKPRIRLAILGFLNKMATFHETFDFLIIISSELKKVDKNVLNRVLMSKYPNLKYRLWDVTDLTPLFNKYAEYITDLVPQIRNKALQNIVNKSLKSTNWKDERDKLIEKLKEAHTRDDLTLFVGAGVSASAGLPDWNTLLSRLLVNLITKNLPNDIEVNSIETLTIANSLQKINISSPLLEARYVNSGLGDDFEKDVASILYKEVEDNTTSDLIKAIANICIPPRGALGVRAIVNYNFDDLLENGLKSVGLRYRPIYRDIDIPTKEELGIFHVHGFLPRQTENYDGISESLLVFSEKNYHTLMQDPYFWSNLIQLNFFRENTCLLIGLSGTDPNLRRLLEIGKRKTKFAKHYILLKRISNEIFINEFTEKKMSSNDSLIDAVNSIHHNLQERSFDELGLKIIWYEKYEDLPYLLNSINQR